MLEQIETFANETSSDSDALSEKIEAVGADVLGVPSAAVALNSWERQNIRYVSAQDAKADLAQFAEIFGIDVDLDTLLVEE